MRILQTKYYIMEQKRKDSFGGWMQHPEISIVKGCKAKNNRPYITKDFNPAFMVGNPTFELSDGHIRGHRPTTTSVRQAIDFLDNNPFSQVFMQYAY